MGHFMVYVETMAGLLKSVNNGSSIDKKKKKIGLDEYFFCISAAKNENSPILLFDPEKVIMDTQV